IGHMSEVWYFSTYLSTLFGHMLTGFPCGDIFAGINIYTGLVISAGVIISYFFLTRGFNADRKLVFAGELLMMSLCYSPTVIVYNHLSNFLVLLSVICIYYAMTGENKFLFIAAGSILGINVFVRFSNLTQAAFILSVWSYIYFNREKYKGKVFKKIVGDTLYCLAGYLGSITVMLIYMGVKYGVDRYINGILGLFSMSSDAEYYTFSYMLKDMVISYLKGMHRILYPVFFGIAACGISCLISHRIKDERKNKRFRTVVLSLCILIMIGIMIWRKLLQFDFYHYAVVYFTAAALLDIVIVISIYNIISKDRAVDEKMLSVFVLLQILLTSVGSNTGISVTMNSMYLSAPYLLLEMSRLIHKSKERAANDVKAENTLIMMTVLSAFVAVLWFQSFFFGISYVYEEGNNTGRRDYYVDGNRVLNNIKLSEERADCIQNISDYVNENGLNKNEVIVYGFAPAIGYYLDMIPVMTTWPDLASYSVEEMKGDMTRIKNSLDKGEMNYPVIIIGDLLKTSGIAEEPAKTRMITDFMEEYDYSQVYEYDVFEIWRRVE
nr:hypothetical protein [Lachnospiraceae bacterium]